MQFQLQFHGLRCVQGQILLKNCLVLNNVTVCQLVLLCFGLFNVKVTEVSEV